MLRSSFLLLDGVGPTTERSLWQQGYSDWAELLAGLEDARLGTACRESARKCLQEAERCLACGEHQWFARRLGLAEAWRAWSDFRDKTVYLDIETDGGMRGDSVTMIGMYDGNEFVALRKGHDIEEFPDRISHYSMIVTFFGSGFDLPMLQRRFWNLRLDQLHFDLCPTLKRLGYRGGLKKIERQLGIQRGEDTDGLSGMDAVALWRAYERGDESALERLVAYNREDVVNLERLAEIAYGRLSATLRTQLPTLC